MKNYKIYIISVFTALFFSSCNDQEFSDEYYANTYGTYSADYKSLMTGAISDFAQRGGQNFYMKPMLYSQYMSQVVYTSESQYAQVGGQWDWYYVRSIKNLDTIIKAYSGNVDNLMTAQGSKENMIGVSKILRAIIYKRLTDAYGDIPYSEANKYDESILTPKFDSQESIYKSLISELKEGRDLLNSATTRPIGDNLYLGDVLKWKKLANSVILQSSLQLSKKYPDVNGYAATEFKSALANSGGVIETVADEAWFTYSALAGITNPIYSFRAADYRLSAQLVESLKGSTSTFNRTSNHTSDARRTVYATNTNPGLPYGYSATDLATAGFTTSSKSQMHSRFRTSTAIMNLMSASYTFLNRAEAAARGWTTEDATTMLEKGIKLNYESLDTKYSTTISSSASAYAAARVADIANYGALRVIGEEKWISLFNNGFYSWAEWRRTGYPNLLPAPSSLNGGEIPRRIMYPTSEAIYNKTNYTAALQSLSPGTDLNTSKVWWDQ